MRPSRAPLIGTAVSVVGAMALAGCRVGPEFQAPETEVPARYQNGPSSLSVAGPRADWWTAFGSRQLDELIGKARRDNTDLIGAVARVRQADAQARIIGAALLPSVQGVTNNGPEQQEALQGQRRQHVLYNGVLTASYELDVWGKNRSALDAAEASAAASRYARDVVDITVTTGVASLYFQYLGSLDRLRVANATLAQARRTLSNTMAEERQGIVAHQAVLLQDSAVATLETAVPPLQQQLATTKDALAILVGELPERLQLGAGSLDTLRQPAIRAGQPSELLTRRPDILEAEENLVAANADIRVARAQFLPSFAFNLNGGINALQGGTLPIPPGPLAAVAVYSLLSNVTQPIFKGGALTGQLDQATANYQGLLLGTYRKTVLTAFGEVEDALAAVKATAAEKATQQRAVSTSQGTAGVANSGLSGGTGTILTVLSSQSAVYTAQDALVQARLAYLQALVSLIKALGGGWRP